MPKIIATGGGEIGRPGFPMETTKIDLEIIRLSGKKRPRLLFLPTASSDAAGYVETVKKYFGQRLSCHVETLYLLNCKINLAKIKKIIMTADIIYVGGGNTLKMMNIWRQSGVADLLALAAKKGIVLSGVSAGAICWFRYGHSDSKKLSNQKASYIRVRGLDLYPLLVCPHYDFEKDRQPSLRSIMKRTKEVAIALDNCSALEIIDDKYRLLTSKPKAGAYRCYWKKGVYYREQINLSTSFRPLNELLKK